MVGWAQGECQAAGRAGGLGRTFATTFTRRGRRCLQDIQEHRWIGTRLHQHQGHSAVASRTASAIHRFAHGFPCQAGQTLVLGTHDGFEAQAIRRSSHNRSHGCAVACALPLTQAAGAKVGERARRDPLLGLPGQGVRPCGLGSSKGAAAAGGFFATGPGQILRTCRSRSSLGGGSQNKLPKATIGLVVRFLRRLAVSRGRQACHFLLLGLRDHPSRSQWHHHSCQTMLALLEIVSSRLPTYRLWNVVNDISGHVAGSPRMVQVLTAEAARLLVEGLQARHLPLSKGKSNVLVDGTDNLKQDLSRQLDLLGIDECDTARNIGADLLLGRRRRALVAGEGSEAHETSQAAAEGTNSQSDSH